MLCAFSDPVLGSAGSSTHSTCCQQRWFDRAEFLLVVSGSHGAGLLPQAWAVLDCPPQCFILVTLGGMGNAIKGIPASHLNLVKLFWRSDPGELIVCSEKLCLPALPQEISFFSSNTPGARRTNEQEHSPEVLNLLLQLSCKLLSSPLLFPDLSSSCTKFLQSQTL